MFNVSCSTGIPKWELPSPSSAFLPIPESTCETHVLVMWPKDFVAHTNETCSCPLSTLDILNFDNCVHQCHSQLNITYIPDESIILDYSKDESLFVHFVCQINPCKNMNRSDCYLHSIIASHWIQSNRKLASIIYFY